MFSRIPLCDQGVCVIAGLKPKKRDCDLCQVICYSIYRDLREYEALTSMPCWREFFIFENGWTVAFRSIFPALLFFSWWSLVSWYWENQGEVIFCSCFHIVPSSLTSKPQDLRHFFGVLAVSWGTLKTVVAAKCRKSGSFSTISIPPKLLENLAHDSKWQAQHSWEVNTVEMRSPQKGGYLSFTRCPNCCILYPVQNDSSNFIICNPKTGGKWR